MRLLAPGCEVGLTAVVLSLGVVAVEAVADVSVLAASVLELSGLLVSGDGVVEESLLLASGVVPGVVVLPGVDSW